MNYVLWWLFLLETCCSLFFHSHNCRTFIFSSWNLLCAEFFFHETYFILIWNKLHVFLSWNLLQADLLFVKYNVLFYHNIFLLEKCCMLFFSWNMMHVDSIHEIMLHVDYFFKKLNVSWFMPSRNLLYFISCS